MARLKRRMGHSGGATGAAVTRGNANPYPRGNRSQKKIKAIPQAVFGTRARKTMPNIRARYNDYGKGV